MTSLMWEFWFHLSWFFVFFVRAAACSESICKFSMLLIYVRKNDLVIWPYCWLFCFFTTHLCRCSYLCENLYKACTWEYVFFFLPFPLILRMHAHLYTYMHSVGQNNHLFWPLEYSYHTCIYVHLCVYTCKLCLKVPLRMYLIFFCYLKKNFPVCIMFLFKYACKSLCVLGHKG